MPPDKFEALVRRLEGYATREPAAYRTRVFLLSLLGYAYIGVILLLLMALTGLLIWVALFSRLDGRGAIVNWVWALVVFAFVIVRSLWVRLPPPEGLRLSRSQAHGLFELAERFRRTLKAPRADAVVLTDGFNAAVVQHPRLGVMGWHKNYLVVGLPLLQALSPEQLQAVLAHEFGHISRAHGRVGGWVYRVRQSWIQLMTRLEQRRHWGSWIFRPFFVWYVPYFDAYSFVLRRAQEYEADRDAARLVGTRQAADALIATIAYAAFLNERFWPGLLKRANDAPTPPAPYQELPQALRRGWRPVEAHGWVQQALQEETGTTDSHPALRDRLAALGQEMRPVELPDETAAQVYLGAALDSLVEHVNQAWREHAELSWRERYHRAEAGRQRLTELEALARGGVLGHEEAWDRAVLVEEHRGSTAALPLYQELTAVNPDHAGARFALGRLLLAQNDEGGLEHVERAMELDRRAILAGCEVAWGYLARHGREAEAARYRQRARQESAILEAARYERSSLWFSDTYLPHGLPPEQVRRLAQQLARIPQIRRAYLVRKEVQHLPEEAFYALGLEVKAGGPPLLGKKPDPEAIYRRVGEEAELPGETMQIIFDDAVSGRMRKIMRGIPDAEIFRR